MDPESEMELALRQSEAEMSRPATPPEDPRPLPLAMSRYRPPRIVPDAAGKSSIISINASSRKKALHIFASEAEQQEQIQDQEDDDTYNPLYQKLTRSTMKLTYLWRYIFIGILLLLVVPFDLYTGHLDLPVRIGFWANAV